MDILTVPSVIILVISGIGLFVGIILVFLGGAANIINESTTSDSEADIGPTGPIRQYRDTSRQHHLAH